MIVAIIIFLIGFWGGVASASALPPRTLWNTFGPLLVAVAVALAVAAILGGW